MIKLYNLSKLPEEPLRSLLATAMRLAGAKGDVVVKVTRGGYRRASYAKSAAFVYKWFLSHRQHTKASDREDLKRGKVSTDGGYVVMQPHTWGDALDCATSFLETAIHEFAHVYDYQHPVQDGTVVGWSSQNRAGRRPKHGARPEEIRAINRTDDALAKLKRQKARWARVQEEMIALALQMDGLQKKT